MKNWSILLFVLFAFGCGNSNEDAVQEEPVTFVEPIEITQLYDANLKPFYHGVASGDPLHDAVIIWTRVTPAFEGEVEVHWKMANDQKMTDVVQEGDVVTNSEKDYTVKVDVENLEAGKTYYYQFESLGAKSVVGRTKTSGKENVEKVELAFASCSNYEWGYFNSYALIANDDALDAVIHLGDYIYEYAPGEYGDTTIGRKVYPAKEIVMLSDYRYRYSQYRTDPDLQAAHAKHPFITVWDDHETANNSYTDGAQNHNEDEGEWSDRKKWATQVYYEWLPVRDDKMLYRTFEFGDLVSMFMLDTRLEGRTVQVDSMTDPHYMDADRKMIGDAQMEALMEELNRPHSWKIIGNQVPFGPMINDYEHGKGRYMDGWDGYPVERAKLVTLIQEANIQNLIIMTGDYHSSFAFETDLDGTKSAADNIAVEFVVPSINSANTNEYVSDDTTALIEAAYLKFNKHLKYVNLSDHGYTRLTITKEEVKEQFIYAKTLRERSTESIQGKAFVVRSGSAVLNAE